MKKFKTVLAMILALAMVLSLAACGNGGTTPGTATPGVSTPAEGTPDPDGGEDELGTYRISYALLGSVWILSYMEQHAAWAVKHMGDNIYNYYSADFTADTMQSGTQNAINSGVDGVIYYAAYPTLTPTVIEMFDAAGIPFVMHDMNPLAEQKDMVMASPNFVGFFSSSAYDNGYALGVQAAEDGYKNGLAIGGHVGDPTHDSRIQGFTDAFEAGGGTVLGEARCTSPAEAVQKASDLINAYPEADCIFSTTDGYTDGALSAIATYSRELMIYTIDVSPEYGEHIKAGTMVGNGGAVVATILSCALLQNWLDGHPILDENGNVPYNEDLRNIYVYADNVEDFNTYILSDEIIPEDAFRQLLWRYNPDVTYDTYLEFCENYSLEYIMELHGA